MKGCNGGVEKKMEATAKFRFQDLGSMVGQLRLTVFFGGEEGGGRRLVF